jgi:membrane-associated PAP2 superfamily phosphatase
MNHSPHPLAQRVPQPARLTLACLAAALAWDAAGFDLPLARLAGSAAGFPARHSWWLAEVLHEGGRRLSWLLALAICLAPWWPVGPLRRLPRGRRVQLAVSTLVAASAVALLKAGSSTSCPWDLAEFGGAASYVSHWDAVPDGGSGRCFPAGHASSGFSFVGGYFAFRRSDSLVAQAWLIAAVAAGLLLGLAQQWRGAHFASHTLWSGVVCWCCAYAIDLAWPSRPAA